MGDTINLAVIDASFDVGHEDLQENIWRNPAEISDDSIDNDMNGFIDDVFGLQLINETDDHDQGRFKSWDISTRYYKCSW